MELKDINGAPNKRMNKLLESRYGFVLDYESMTPAKAQRILSVINESIAQVKKSSAAHTAYKDPKYMEMLMVKESVSKYMKDYKPENGPHKKTAKMSKVSETTVRESIKEMSQGRNLNCITRAVELASQGKPVPSKYMEGFVPLLKHITARKLTEGELGKSEVLLASKDMVDTLQEMIEDLSRMVNEELPQLTDSIRDQVGNEQAAAFEQTATASLNGLLEAVRGARSEMDSAARALAGEQVDQPMSMPNDPMAADAGADLGLGDSDMDADDSDGFGATDSAAGGDLGLGREQR
jgi:hypothetical protein